MLLLFFFLPQLIERRRHRLNTGCSSIWLRVCGVLDLNGHCAEGGLWFCFFYQSVQNMDICEIIKMLMGCKTLLDPRLENKILISLQRLLGAQCDQIKGYADVCLKKKQKNTPCVYRSLVVQFPRVRHIANRCRVAASASNDQ